MREPRIPDELAAAAREVEPALVSSILLSPAELPAAEAIVGQGDFLDPRLGTIFGALGGDDVEVEANY